MYLGLFRDVYHSVHICLSSIPEKQSLTVFFHHLPLPIQRSDTGCNVKNWHIRRQAFGMGNVNDYLVAHQELKYRTMRKLNTISRTLLIAASIAMAGISARFLIQDLPAKVPVKWTTKCITEWDSEGKKTKKQECTSGGNDWPCDCGWGDPTY